MSAQCARAHNLRWQENLKIKAKCMHAVIAHFLQNLIEGWWTLVGKKIVGVCLIVLHTTTSLQSLNILLAHLICKRVC